MKRNNLLHIAMLFFCLFLFSNQNIKAQKKIDTDSLLTVIVTDMKTNHPDYQLNIQRALLGKKLAPDYLDFHLILGRNYDLTKVKDSARYYYNYVIKKNPVYEDAFHYLINLDIEEKKYDEGLEYLEKCYSTYKKDENFKIHYSLCLLKVTEIKNDEKMRQKAFKFYGQIENKQQIPEDIKSELKF